MIFIQLLGMAGFAFLALSFFKKNRKQIFISQIISYIFYTFHYLLLNAKSGFIISIVNLAKCLFLTAKEKYKFLQNNIMLFVFIIIYILATYYSYQDLFSLFPAVGTIIYTSMLWQGTMKEIRIGAIINSTLWVIYDVHVSSYVGTLSDSTIVIINIILLMRMCKNDQINKRKASPLTR